MQTDPIPSLPVSRFRQYLTTCSGAVVLTGAGVSARSPAWLPTGITLTTWLLQTIQEPLVHADARIAGLFQRTPDLHRRLTELGLEVVMQIIFDLLGRRSVDLLDVLDATMPTPTHQALAHAPWLSALMTVNFDRLHEIAFAQAHARYLPLMREADYRHAPLPSGVRPLYKLHGSLDHPGTIMATLRQVGRAFALEKHRALLGVLQGQTVLVLGYGGRDHDINAVLQAADLRTLFWMARAPEHLSRSAVELLRTKHGTIILGRLEDSFPAPSDGGSSPPPLVTPPASWSAMLAPWRYRLLGALLGALSVWEEARACFQYGLETDARVTADSARLCDDHLQIGKQLLYHGAYPEALASFTRAEAYAEQCSTPLYLTDCHRGRAETQRQHGDYTHAIEGFQLATQEYEDIIEKLRKDQVVCLMGEVANRGLLGDYDEDAGRRAMAMADAVGDSILMATARLHLGNLLKWLGQFDHAQVIIQEEMRIAEEYHDHLRIAWARWNQADLHRLRGNMASAQPHAQDALTVFTAYEHRHGQFWCHELLAEAARFAGDYPTMDTHLHAAAQFPDPVANMYLLLNHADAARMQGQYADAIALFRSAWRQARRIHDRREMVVSRLGIVNTLRLAGTPDLREARRVVRQCARLRMAHLRVHASIAEWCTAARVGVPYDIDPIYHACRHAGYVYEAALIDAFRSDPAASAYPFLFP
jgi:tetratricopeptide (TPR) repeat protein